MTLAPRERASTPLVVRRMRSSVCAVAVSKKTGLCSGSLSSFRFSSCSSSCSRLSRRPRVILIAVRFASTMRASASGSSVTCSSRVLPTPPPTPPPVPPSCASFSARTRASRSAASSCSSSATRRCRSPCSLSAVPSCSAMLFSCRLRSASSRWSPSDRGAESPSAAAVAARGGAAAAAAAAAHTSPQPAAAAAVRSPASRTAAVLRAVLPASTPSAGSRTAPPSPPSGSTPLRLLPAPASAAAPAAAATSTAPTRTAAAATAAAAAAASAAAASRTGGTHRCLGRRRRRLTGRRTCGLHVHGGGSCGCVVCVWRPHSRSREHKRPSPPPLARLCPMKYRYCSFY
eukprot:Rhum_TRINITY_DN14705_c11_g2::Rhum_TRINITY_DN14705_c11_g2_i1::g.112261::m.112261